MKDAHVTLRDVARRARVSVSTASRALCGIKVRDGSADRILKAARELGYVHNEAARSLRNVRTMTIGMVFHALTSPVGIELLSSVSELFDARGYSVFVATAQGDAERYDRIVHRFLQRRVDALLCVHAAGKGVDLDRFMAARVPTVALLSKEGGYDRLPLVAPSIRVAAQECVARLTSLGHKRIVVMSARRFGPTLERFAPIAETGGMQVRTVTYENQTFDPAAVLKAVLGRSRRETVIVTNQTEAAHLLVAAERMSVQVPGELSLVGVRDRAVLVPLTPIPLSMINIDPRRLGTAAVEMLIEHLSSGALVKRSISVEDGVWLERATTGRAA